MEKRTLYIVVAIVIVAALVLAFSQLTGQSTSPGGEVGECLDSDGGEDPYTSGVASYTNRNDTYPDECYSRRLGGEEKYLKEYYCLDGITSNRYYCEDGCLENADGVGYCEGSATLET